MKLVPLMFLLCLGGCCSEVAYSPYYSVTATVRSDEGPLPPGSYLFEVDTHTQSWQLQCNVPVFGALQEADCASTPAMDAPKVFTEEGTFHLSVAGNLDQLTLTVMLDGAVLGSQSFQPHYSPQYANGPAAVCGPSNFEADVTMKVALSTQP
jgi:hypothetical protein